MINVMIRLKYEQVNTYVPIFRNPVLKNLYCVYDLCNDTVLSRILNTDIPYIRIHLIYPTYIAP